MESCCFANLNLLLFCHARFPRRRRRFKAPYSLLKACLHGGGGPQVGEVTRLGGVTRLSI